MLYNFMLIDKDKNSVVMKLTYEEAKQLSSFYNIKNAVRNGTRDNLNKEITKFLRERK